MGCGAIEIVTEKVKLPVPFNKDSKIAIIGAGAGGAHMAYLLKKKGYENITIFEKEDYVGGKANHH